MSTIGSNAPAWWRVEVVTSVPARRAIGVLAFVLATALSARLALPIPGTPVPFTFQPLVVLLAGALLGARLGAASQLAYLAAGAVGLPVFAAGGGAAYLLGPTGGYLMAYPLAAFVVGALAGGTAVRLAVGLVAGLVVIYAGGVAWLTVLGGFDAAVAMGLRPFVLADLVKAMLVLLVALRLRSRSRELFGA
jgi:biotin transport system substrate-specific component